MPHALCLLTHDLHPYGAQRVARSLTRNWVGTHGRHVEVIACGGGALSADIRRIAPLTQLGAHWRESARRIETVLPVLHAAGVRAAVTNTVIAGCFVPVFQRAGIPSIALIHEMPTLIREEGLGEHLRLAHQHAAMVIYPHESVQSAIRAAFPDLPNWHRVRVMAQGLEAANPFRNDRHDVRHDVRRQLEIGPDRPLVLAIGTGDRRKGIDLFLDAALAIERTVPPDAAPCLLWIGPLNDRDLSDWQSRHDGRALQSIRCLRWLDYQAETMLFHAAADLFALSSREDPFPYVALESLNAGVPLLAFAGSGGGSDLAGQGGGRTVMTRTGEALAEAMLDYIANPAQREQDGRRGMATVDSRYRFDTYADQLLQLADDVVNDVGPAV